MGTNIIILELLELYMINSFTFKCLKTSITRTRSLIKMMMHHFTINRQDKICKKSTYD